jgi:hypothetical protein
MQCTINNFRGLASASLDLTRICLLAGPNEAGKTSASQALAAALTGEPVPITGVKKTQAGLLVRSGTASGSVTLTGANGATTITWPAAKVKTEGQAPFASHFATGLQSIVNLDDKERVKVLTEYLKATPTRADLAASLVSMNLPETVIDQLWKLIETQGWDNAASQIKEKGARLKGQWENITGDRYGSKKGDSWIPEGYDNELMGQSETTLQAIVTDARDAMEAAIATDAVDDSRRGDLEALAALLPERTSNRDSVAAVVLDNATVTNLDQQVRNAMVDVTAAERFRDTIKVELTALQAPPTAASKTKDRMFCPECKTMLRVKGEVLERVADEQPQLVDTAAIEAKTKALTDAEKAITECTAIRHELQAKYKTASEAHTAAVIAHSKELTEAERLVKESTDAQAELAIPAAAPSTVSVDDCRTTLALAEKRLKAFTQKHEADRLHVAIGNNAELLSKIVPEGIRGDVLTRALKGFNDALVPICKAAGWRTVALEPDFLPTYGGTIYLLLSESAKFRVRVILQMGMALIDKSQALVIDAADILDKGGRNGLFKAVKQVALPCMVSMTIDSKDLVPNLAKAGFGQSYWLNGEATTEAISAS